MSSLLSLSRTFLSVGLISGISWTAAAQTAFSLDGEEYRIINSMPGDQNLPHTAINALGGYLVWQDNATDGDGLGISARRLNQSLSGSLGTFRVNEDGAGDQRNPKVALLKDGGAVFVWQGGVRGFSKIRARFFAPDGTFSSGDITVSSHSGNQQNSPVVAALNDGGAIVVWSSFGQDGDMQGVFGQRFSSAGAKVGAEFQINQATTYNQRAPSAAVLENGNFVVTWVSENYKGLAHNVDQSGRDTDGRGGLQVFDVAVMARLYSSEGVPAGNEFKANSSALLCANPVVQGTASGFTVVWTGKPSRIAIVERRTDGWDIFARQFNAQGASSSEDIAVNSYKYGDQFMPQIASLASEQLIVWTSMNQDGSHEGIVARLLSPTGELVSREFRVNTTTFHKQLSPTVASDGNQRYLVSWASFTRGVASFDLFAQRYGGGESLQPLIAPFISAQSQTRLSVTWPEATGYSGVQYEVSFDGGEAITVAGNSWTALSLAPGSFHSARVAYKLPDGRRSGWSDAGTGKTWAEDENFDGLPDDWQTLYWGESRTGWRAASEDSDNDGATNLMEFLAGTDPVDAASVLGMRITSSAQGWRLVWNTKPGAIYQVQASRDAHTWTDFGVLRFSAGTTDSLPIPADTAVGIYRVIKVR